MHFYKLSYALRSFLGETCFLFECFENKNKTAVACEVTSLIHLLLVPVCLSEDKHFTESLFSSHEPKVGLRCLSSVCWQHFQTALPKQMDQLESNFI